MNEYFTNSTGSATLSGKVALNVSTNNIDPSHNSIQPVSYNGLISGNGYLQNQVMYFDHNQDFANLVNTYYYLNTGRYGNDSADYKYYYNVPQQGDTRITSDVIAPWYLSIRNDIWNYLYDMTAEIRQSLSANKYSNTKYGITMDCNVLQLLEYFKLNVTYGVDDSAKGKLSVIFDTNYGIEEITFKYDVDYKMTIREQYAGSEYMLEQLKAYLNETAVSSKGSVDLKMTFAYGNKVKVNTLKDTSTYTTPVPGGTGGSSKPGRIEISTGDFINYFQKMDDNNVVPKLAFYDGYYDGSDSGYSESFGVYNGDYSNLTDDQNYLTLFPRNFSNRDVLIQMLETDTTTSYRCYVSGDSFELEGNQVGGDGYFEFSFNQKGHVTRFYLVSGGYKLNVNISYTY